MSLTVIEDGNIHNLVKTYIENPTELPSFLQNIPIGQWDVSRVTNMSFVFEDFGSFNESINDWNVSNVTDMKGMFYWCSIFDQPLNKWNVSNVENMSDMFNECKEFNQSLNEWDVSKVTNMSSMFLGCNTFNRSLNKWDVGKVTNMKGMFYWCTNFNKPLFELRDDNEVTNMESMFSNCENFDVFLNKWNVSKVTNMKGMFFRCKKFNKSLKNWDVSKVTDMENMFYHCENFNRELTWDLTGKNIDHMFSGSPLEERMQKRMEEINSTLKPSITLFINMHGIENKSTLGETAIANFVVQLPDVTVISTSGKLGLCGIGDFKNYGMRNVKNWIDKYKLDSKNSKSVNIRNQKLESLLEKKCKMNDTAFCYFPSTINEFHVNFSQAQRQVYNKYKPHAEDPKYRTKYRRKAILNKTFVLHKQIKEGVTTYSGGIYILSSDNDNSIRPDIQDCINTLLWDGLDNFNFSLLNYTNMQKLDEIPYGTNSLEWPGPQAFSSVNFNDSKSYNIYNYGIIDLFKIIILFKRLGYENITIFDASCKVLNGYDIVKHEVEHPSTEHEDEVLRRENSIKEKEFNDDPDNPIYGGKKTSKKHQKNIKKTSKKHQKNIKKTSKKHQKN
jgi:surface protein